MMFICSTFFQDSWRFSPFMSDPFFLAKPRRQNIDTAFYKAEADIQNNKTGISRVGTGFMIMLKSVS